MKEKKIKMKKLFIFVLVLVTVLITFAFAENGGFLRVDTDGNIVECENVYVIIDYETGVNYIYVYNNFSGSITICPRYNTDGTIYSGYSD
jgi:hypothetical protein